MGKLKLYQAGKSFLSWDFCNDIGTQNIPVPTWLDVDGNTRNVVCKPTNYRASNGAYCEFNGAYACTDVIENKTEQNYPLFNASDYTASNVVGTTTISASQKTDGTTSSRCTFTVTVKNTENAEILFNCIKFTKGIKTANNGTQYTSLYMAYFFDNSITIEAGQTKVFTFAFDWDKE